jgi:Flp pilus assembly pilin Flp
MVEYAVMLALILLVIVAAARTLGCSVNSTFSRTAQSIGS